MGTRILYRHPKGRFEVHETVGHSALGGTYRIREAFLTPQKDARGTFSRKAPQMTILEAPKAEKRGGAARRFTETELQSMKQLFHKGKSVSEISKQLGRSESAVRRALTKAGLRVAVSRNGWSADDLELAQELRAKGMTCRAIGRELGRTEAAVASVLKYERKRKTG